MHDICQPLVYRSLKLIRSKGQGQSSLQVILRSLLSPGGETLGTYVRSLHVQLDDDYTEHTHPSPHDLALFAATATPLELSQALATQAGQLGLLLHRIPRLQVLTLTTPALSTDLFSQYIDAHGTPLALKSHPLCLQHLHKFQCLNGRVSTKALLILLQLPSIRKLAVRLTLEPSTPLHTIEAAAGTSHVTSLQFTSTNITSAVLTHILQIPIALTEFSFTAREPYSIFPISRFGALLQPLRNTLQHLHIDLSTVVPQIAGHQHSSHFRLGSFRDWAALQTVRCSLSILLGRGMVRGALRLADLLPLGLQELDIQGDKYWSVDEEVDRLIELLQEGDTVMSGLKRLAVGRGRQGLRSKNRLTVACEIAGVELVDNGKGRGERAVVRRRTFSRRTCDMSGRRNG